MPAGDAAAAAAAHSVGDATPPPQSPAGGVLALLSQLRLKGGKQRAPGACESSGSQEAGAAEQTAATLTEVAGIISSLARDHLGSLLSHPGHATVGVYYLAKRHQLQREADHIDGSRVSDKALVQELLRAVDIADSVYPDRYDELIKQQQVVKEADIVHFHTQVHKLQPGFYLALDHAAKRVLWVIRGTHDLHDLLTDIAGAATPIPGGAAHWGMARAAGWLLDTQWDRVLQQLRATGYSLQIIGHSMGAGVGALLALRLNAEEGFKQQLGGTKVTCIGVATAACLSPELAAACADSVVSLVLRHDLVPRCSAAALETMTQELLELDYRGLLHSDLMEHEVYRGAADRAASVAAKAAANPLLQRVAAAAGAAAGAAKSKAGQGAGALAKHLNAAVAGAEAGAANGSASGPAAAALQNDKVRQAAGWVAHTLNEAAQGGAGQAAAGTGAAGAPGGPGPAEQSFDDSGEADAVAAAAAAGEIVAVPLVTPGRLYYIKPVDDADGVDEEQQRFELLDGRADQRFKRIVLRSTCMHDHFPAAYKLGLSSVLAGMGRPSAEAPAAAPATAKA